MTKARENADITGRKNFLINGGFELTQRAASATLTNERIEYDCPDRWLVGAISFTTLSGTIQTANLTTEAGAVRRSLNYAAVTNTGAGSLIHIQKVEAASARKFRGQTYTLSFEAYHDAGEAVDIVHSMYTANGVDDFISNGGVTLVAGSTQIVSVPHTGSGVSKKYSFTFTLPDDAAIANGLYVQLDWSLTNNYTSKSFYLTNVQLELGDSASAFEDRPIGEETLLCKRYYYRIAGSNADCWMASMHSANNAYGVVHHPVTMRVQPSIGRSDVSHINITTTGTVFVSTGIANGSTAGDTCDTTLVLVTRSGGGLTTGNAGWIELNTGTGWIDFNAEL